jgi:hypothetical protein
MCQPRASTLSRPAIGRPAWGMLYAAIVPQLAALAAVELGGPPNAVRITLRWALAMGMFAAMGAWVRANRAAIDLQDWCECAPRTITMRVIESRRHERPDTESEALALEWSEEAYALIRR